MDQGFPRLTNEVRAPELVHVSEKNLSEIENVHGYVSHAHISPLKVSVTARLPSPAALKTRPHSSLLLCLTSLSPFFLIWADP